MAQPPATDALTAPVLTAGRQLLRRWWLILLVGIIGAGVFAFRDSRQTKQYQATATLEFGTDATDISGLVNQTSGQVDDLQRDQATAVLLVTSSSVAQRVRLALKLDESADSLAGSVVASAEADANLIDVTATDPDPRRAALLANTFAEQYRGFQLDSERKSFSDGIVQLQAKEAALPPTATAQRQRLEDSITTLQQQSATATGGVQLVDEAEAPGSPASPKTKRDIVLGALLGLFVGAGMVFLLEAIDRRLRSVSAIETAYGRVALAALPHQRRAPRDERERLTALEPFRILRTSLGQGAAGISRTVLVTSAVPGEGKSTTAAGLARALAYGGQRVVLVELDLRRPTFHERFALPQGHRGLVDVLRNRSSVADAVVEGIDGQPTLSVLPAGGTPARSAELLASPEARRTFSELAATYDAVVLDAPPLLPVADTQSVLDSEDVDLVILVARLTQTTRDEATRARRIVERHGWPEFGLVVNGLRRSDGGYNYESYGDRIEDDSDVPEGDPYAIAPAAGSATQD